MRVCQFRHLGNYLIIARNCRLVFLFKRKFGHVVAFVVDGSVGDDVGVVFEKIGEHFVISISIPYRYSYNDMEIAVMSSSDLPFAFWAFVIVYFFL